MRRISFFVGSVVALFLLVGCSKLDEEGVRSLERVGVVHSVTEGRVLITEVQNPAQNGWTFPIKYKGDTAAAVVAEDRRVLAEALETVESPQLVPLDQYAASPEYEKALRKAKKRSVSTLQPVMDQENLDGILWVNRTYSIFARPTLIRWEKYWWYGVISTELRLYDREGHQVLRHSWQSYSSTANLSARPTEEEAIAALSEAHHTADRDVAQSLTAALSSETLPELGDPKPVIPNKWLLDAAIFVRGALIAGAVLLSFSMLMSLKEKGGCFLALLGLVLLAGAVYLLGWHAWWRDVWKFIEIIGELAGD